MKTCSRCKLSKPESEFYAERRAKDGLASHCKKCHCVRTDAYRRSHLERMRELNRVRPKDPLRHKKYIEKNPGVRAKNRQRWRELNRIAHRAHTALSKAIMSGKIVKPAQCEQCGRTGVLHGHHHDYAKKLEVTWLCVKCHGLTRRIGLSQEAK
jgi:hypothetical protein